MLELRDLSFNYQNCPVLSKINFILRKNRTVAFLGPSGCGKTTLLKIIGGLLEPSDGKVIKDNGGGSVAFVFQDFRLLPWSTVYQNVELVLQTKNRAKTELRKQIERVLVMTGLIDFIDVYPYQLSGGMQQRLGLARALVTNPALLLLDEPFSAVDGQTRQLLVEEFQTICQQKPITRIMVTHSLDDVIDMANDVVLLSARPAKVMAVIDVDSHIRLSGKEEVRLMLWKLLKEQVRENDSCRLFS